MLVDSSSTCGLICCVPYFFNHIIDPCGLCLDNTIVLVVIITCKVEHLRPDEIYDGEVCISLTGG